MTDTTKTSLFVFKQTTKLISSSNAHTRVIIDFVKIKNADHTLLLHPC